MYYIIRYNDYIMLYRDEIILIFLNNESDYNIILIIVIRIIQIWNLKQKKEIMMFADYSFMAIINLKF